MPRSCGLALTLSFFLATSLFADDQALWREYGLVHSETAKHGKVTFTAYEMKDTTGALAAWEWLRSPSGRSCDLAAFCTREPNQTVLADDNYVLVFPGRGPLKSEVSEILAGLPNKHETSLPAILTFLPRQGLVPDSARYILGPVSLHAFAPQLAGVDTGLAQGAEAQAVDYNLRNEPKPVRLVLFYYPSPEMARLHMAQLKSVPGVILKRSGVLVAVVLPPATVAQADALLSRVQYEAKITWNDTPPPPPLKPLYQLILNIVYLSCVLAGICLLGGLIYAGMRLYRRRYGTLEADEAMTTLHLTGK